MDRKAKESTTNHRFEKSNLKDKLMSRNSRWKWPIIAVVFVATIIAVLIGSLRPAANVALTDISDIEQLRARFNQDKGTPRLLLLLSPT